MFKKLKERKGFTLAELLVVIAILAILIAIAIPVFSNMVAEANLRVNQANVHSTKSAAVTKILTNMDKKDDQAGSTQLLNAGLKKPGDSSGILKAKGWVALADVDNSGNITNLRVFACDGKNLKANLYADAIYTHSFAGAAAGTVNVAELQQKTSKVDDYYPMPADVDTNSKFATVKPTTKEKAQKTTTPRTTYTVQVVITDLDLTAKD